MHDRRQKMLSLLNIWCYCIYTSLFQASDSGVGREIREREKTVIKRERGSQGRYV